MTQLEQLAGRIRELRAARGWRQEDLAAQAHLTRGYIARLETARHDPTLTTLLKLARALKVPVAKLLA
jgi:transcriptional regulator with XRE-family HTH domain